MTQMEFILRYLQKQSGATPIYTREIAEAMVKEFGFDEKTAAARASSMVSQIFSEGKCASLREYGLGVYYKHEPGFFKETTKDQTIGEKQLSSESGEGVEVEKSEKSGMKDGKTQPEANEELLVKTLPVHLQVSINGFLKAKYQEDDILQAMWWGEIYGSINSAETDMEISSDLAWKLREKYLGMVRNYDPFKEEREASEKGKKEEL